MASYIFSTNFRPAAAWYALPKDKRRELADWVLHALDQLPDQGVEILAWGLNDPDTDRRVPYEGFCVYKVRDQAAQRQFEESVRASEWYLYFDQVAASGPAMSPTALLDKMCSL